MGRCWSLFLDDYALSCHAVTASAHEACTSDAPVDSGGRSLVTRVTVDAGFHRPPPSAVRPPEREARVTAGSVAADAAPSGPARRTYWTAVGVLLLAQAVVTGVLASRSFFF